MSKLRVVFDQALSLALSRTLEIINSNSLVVNLFIILTTLF